MMEAVMAFQPVPEPAVTGGGKSVAFVKLITNIPVDDYSMSNAQLQEFLDDFSETKIKEYSQSLGDVSSPVPEPLLGNLTFEFFLENSDCEKVALWLHQIVNSSQVFTAAPMTCPFVMPNLLANTVAPPAVPVVSSPPKEECIANVVEGETHQAVISIVSTLKWDPSQNSILQQLYERILAPQLSQLGCLVGGKAEKNWSGNFVIQYVVVNTKCNEVAIAKQAIESETSCCVKEVDVLCQ
ncbi:hypothetical protein TELCIR_16212 [Teladorsagia circumcincta]|uniref:Uncharacterized protein n=1 Tax=Teladorsagia circumcincta TaxID=45464 RepID=A0A2G9TWB9_TELCI|nr:hypothetical protein TELCIR_16212 [Teladorsagia circumcincta]